MAFLLMLKDQAKWMFFSADFQEYLCFGIFSTPIDVILFLSPHADGNTTQKGI